MTYLWSFDPGLATGAAFGEYGPDRPYQVLATWSIPNGVDGFIEWNFAGYESIYQADEVVCERFIIDGTITGVWAPQIEGVLYYLQELKGFPITWQLRTDKTMLTAGSESKRNAWLKAKVPHVPHEMTTQHERDAVTHALVCLKRKRHLPTLKEFWGESND